MSTIRLHISILCFVLVLPLSTMSLDARENTAADERSTTHALDILSRSTEFIESMPAFMVRGEGAGELLLDKEMLVEHGFQFTATFNRPSQFKLLMVGRDGSHSEMYFDGHTITVASMFQGRQIYDSIAQTGDVNESLDYMIQQTGGTRELQFILAEQLTQTLGRMQTATSLGKSIIGDRACDHLAVRYGDRDGQAWIARGEEPAPWRFVIIHREEPQKPRSWIQIEEWDFAPELTEATFRYSPPEGAEKFRYFDD